MDWKSIVAVVIVGTLFAVSMFALATYFNKRALAPISKNRQSVARFRVLINAVVTGVFVYVMYFVHSTAVWVAGGVSLAVLWLWFFVVQFYRRSERSSRS